MTYVSRLAARYALAVLVGAFVALTFAVLLRWPFEFFRLYVDALRWFVLAACAGLGFSAAGAVVLVVLSFVPSRRASFQPGAMKEF